MKSSMVSIKIAGREYALRATDEQKKLLEEAEAMLSQAIEDKLAKHKINDNRDLIAMVLFDAFVEKVQETKKIKDSIDVLSSLLEPSVS